MAFNIGSVKVKWKRFKMEIGKVVALFVLRPLLYPQNYYTRYGCYGAASTGGGSWESTPQEATEIGNLRNRGHVSPAISGPTRSFAKINEQIGPLSTTA